MRLKRDVDKADEMALDTRSTKTTRIRRERAVTATMTVTCPNGHESNDPEWCDTCGAPSSARRRPAAAPPADARRRQPPLRRARAAGRRRRRRAVPALRHAEPADNLFCEQCGYDFTTGQAPPRPSRRGAVAGRPAVDPDAKWVVIVEVDPAWFALKGELADQQCPPASARRRWRSPAHTALVGRTSQSRGVRPEIALDNDTGVSRRHCQFVREGDGRQRRRPVVDERHLRRRRRHRRPTRTPRRWSPACRSSSATAMQVFVGAWSRLTLRAG